ncbi:MAG: hypothetical protein ABIY39_05535 [Sphingomonas sp.]
MPDHHPADGYESHMVGAAPTEQPWPITIGPTVDQIVTLKIRRVPPVEYAARADSCSTLHSHSIVPGGFDV